MFGIWFLSLDTMLWGSSILWYISVLNFFLWLNKIPLKWIAHIYLSIHQLVWNWSLSTSAVLHNAEKHILHEQTLCFRSISVSREIVKLCGNYTFSSSVFFSYCWRLNPISYPLRQPLLRWSAFSAVFSSGRSQFLRLFEFRFWDVCFETENCDIVQAGLELEIL